MNIRKIKQRLDKRNGKWLRYITPRVRSGITYLENQHQLVTAFGSPYPGAPERHEQQPARSVRFQAHIHDTGEVYEFNRSRANVKFEEVDKSEVCINHNRSSPIVVGAGVQWQPGNYQQEWDRTEGRRAINLGSKSWEDMMEAAQRLVDAEASLIKVECMHKGSFSQITADEVKQAAQNFLDMQANQPVADFVTLKNLEVVDDNTLKAELVLRPGSDAEMAIVKRIKEGNPNTYSMSASVKKDN